MTWTNEDASAYQRDWRVRNRDRVRGYRTAERTDRAADKATLPAKDYRRNYFCELHRDRLRRQGFACDLTADDVAWPDVCPIMGRPLNYHRVSLERIDPDGAWAPGNVQFVSEEARRGKRIRQRRYPQFP